MNFEEEVRADAIRPTKDKLEQVRDAVRQLRDLDLEIRELEERTKECNIRKREMMYNTLPHIFMEAAVDSLTLQKEGNLPAYEASLKDDYYTKVTTEWTPQEQEEAFAFLTKRKAADLIKHTIELRFGLKENKLFTGFMSMLRKYNKELHARIQEKQSVPAGTLRAYIKEVYERGGEFSDEELRILGATVGKVVKLKEVHDD